MQRWKFVTKTTRKITLLLQHFFQRCIVVVVYTKHVQRLDVVISKPFEDTLLEQFEEHIDGFLELRLLINFHIPNSEYLRTND